MQVFFRGDGAIVIGVTTKKEFLATCAANRPLANNQWHHVVVCFAAARRHFGQSQISVFVDGDQVLNVSLKFPSLNDVSWSVRIALLFIAGFFFSSLWCVRWELLRSVRRNIAVRLRKSQALCPESSQLVAFLI